MDVKIKEQVEDLLKNAGLKITSSRLEILSIILGSDQALSYQQIASKMATKHDKVTVYRSLKTFTDKQLVHEVKTEDAPSKYSGCLSECSHDKHHDSHVHFTCKICNKTTCLYDVKMPTFNFENGYEADEVILNIKGKCKECA